MNATFASNCRGDRYLRFSVLSGDGAVRHGVIRAGSEVIEELSCDPLLSDRAAVASRLDAPAPTGATHAVNQVMLHAPLAAPSKIIGIGKNYAEHVREMGGPAPASPIVFLKAQTSLIGPGQSIVLPTWSAEVHHEGELAVVIGKPTKDVSAEQAYEHIWGYTCANDVTARDVQRAEQQWTRAKGFDTSCPLGPWITVDPEINPDDLHLRCTVNGQVRQDDTTASMTTSVGGLIAYLSQTFTLLPGDVILTGTPAGVGPIRAGDTVEITIDGIGTLTNPVVGPGV